MRILRLTIDVCWEGPDHRPVSRLSTIRATSEAELFSRLASWLTSKQAAVDEAEREACPPKPKRYRLPPRPPLTNGYDRNVIAKPAKKPGL